MAARNLYSRYGGYIVAGIASLVVAGIAIAYFVVNTQLLSGNYPCGITVTLLVSGRTSTVVVVIVNATTRDPEPLSGFSVVLRLNGRFVALLAPLADGAANGSLTFHDATQPGNLSTGDNFTVSPLSSGAYQLELLMSRCLELTIARATWTV